MSKLNILTVNFSDSRGGAAIATRQQVITLRKNKNVKLDFIVAEKKIQDEISRGPKRFFYLIHFFLRIISYLICKLNRKYNSSKQSLNLFSSNFIVNELKNTDSNIIHLHWINNDTVSIFEINNFLKNNKDKKIIFTLHDDWFFCGSEHCSNDLRYLNGYEKENKYQFGVDIDRIVFSIKKKYLLNCKNVFFTAPSSYLVSKARSSFLLNNANVLCIPNIIDVDVFKKNELMSRKFLNIDDDTFIILFGAIGGGSYLKGSDLLLSSLEKLSKMVLSRKICLLTFGGDGKEKAKVHDFNVINLGHISNKSKLASIYSLADVTIVPSRLESFGQVAAESLSCETPVIAFNNSGLVDIVQNEISGYLVDAFDVDKLTEAIFKIINISSIKRSNMGVNGRRYIINNFSPEIINKQWLTLYTQEIK
ncbi:TPA: glycosyltransferase [Photobacterium damselae]